MIRTPGEPFALAAGAVVARGWRNQALGTVVVETSFRVRYAETDAMGIAYHANYVVWFEVGRGEFMWQQGHSYADLEAQEYFLPVTEVKARYLAPCRYGDVITVRTRVAELRSRQVVFGYEIVSAAGQILCSGETVHLCTDREGRVRALPAWVRELLSR